VLPSLPSSVWRSMWSNQLTVALSLNDVVVINQLRGLSRRSIKQQHIPIEQNIGQITWQQAINMLESMLVSLHIKRNTQLQVVLSGDFVRYLMLPPQQLTMSSAEKSAYAMAAYQEVYGVVADSWQIKLHDAEPNQATIVAAVDNKLLETVKQLSLKYQLNLISVQPYLMQAVNSLRNQLGRINGFLVILESGRLFVMSMRQGHCQNLRTSTINSAVGADWQSELKHILVRESLLGDIDSREVLVYAPTQKNTALIPLEGWNIRRVGQAHQKAINDQWFSHLEVLA